jgi:hypothetical protein
LITLGQSKSNKMNRMITRTNHLLIQTIKLLVIWDFVNLGQYDYINQMITLSVITLSVLHCICFCFSVIRENKHNYLQNFYLFNATLPMIHEFCFGIHFVTTLYLTMTLPDFCRYLKIFHKIKSLIFHKIQRYKMP